METAMWIVLPCLGHPNINTITASEELYVLRQNRNTSWSPPLPHAWRVVWKTSLQARPWPFVQAMSPHWIPLGYFAWHSTSICCPAPFKMDDDTAPLFSSNTGEVEFTMTSTWNVTTMFYQTYWGCTIKNIKNINCNTQTSNIKIELNALYRIHNHI